MQRRRTATLMTVLTRAVKSYYSGGGWWRITWLLVNQIMIGTERRHTLKPLPYVLLMWPRYTGCCLMPNEFESPGIN